jgi:ankyrin repeat protein
MAGASKRKNHVETASLTPILGLVSTAEGILAQPKKPSRTLRSDRDLRNATGQTALMFAVRRYINKAVQLLIEKGANVHAADNSGQTALQIARYENNTSALHLLLKAGAKK